jgi:hypothetical protein
MCATGSEMEDSTADNARSSTEGSPLLPSQSSALSTQHSALRPSRELRITLYALVCLAGILRFADLGSKSFWVDEAYGLLVNATPIQNITERCRNDHTAPLREYYLRFCW